MSLSLSPQPGGPGKSRGGARMPFPVPPRATPLPTHTPRRPAPEEELFEVAVWAVPAYGTGLDGAWAPVAWTPSQADADLVAEGFVQAGYQLVQIWYQGELVGERSAPPNKRQE
jgi:hypothetical protein